MAEDQLTTSILIKYFLKNKINEKLLSIFEKKIGSDFRLFIHKHSFQKSLKKIINLKKRFTFYFVLVFPNINCSTKQVYSKVKKFNAPLKNNLLKIQTINDYIQFIRTDNKSKKRSYKKIPKNKKNNTLIKLQKNCIFSRMTGSGSVCFGAFLDEKSAKQGRRAIQKFFPNYWCVVAKSI